MVSQGQGGIAMKYRSFFLFEREGDRQADPDGPNGARGRGGEGRLIPSRIGRAVRRHATGQRDWVGGGREMPAAFFLLSHG